MKPLHQDDLNTFYQGDATAVLSGLPANSVHCCVTSPPYYGLRSYLPDDHPDKDLEIGSEETPEAFVERMVGVFREVRRVLRDDGTLWLNLGDCYGGSRGNKTPAPQTKWQHVGADTNRSPRGGTSRKSLLGIPWRVALALQDDGWILRQDIIWEKPSAMPSSVKDRCTTSHEYLFMLTKQPRYYYDQEAVKEPAVCAGSRDSAKRGDFNGKTEAMPGRNAFRAITLTRNRRSVWTIATSPYSKAHYATFPPKLIEPCIMAGTSERGCCADCGAPLVRQVEKRTVYRKRPNAATRRHAEGNGVNSTPNDKAGVETITTGWEFSCKCSDGVRMPWKQCTVLDPFLGSGTTAMVANRLGRKCIGIDLSGEYIRDHAIERVAT